MTLEDKAIVLTKEAGTCHRDERQAGSVEVKGHREDMSHDLHAMSYSVRRSPCVATSLRIGLCASRRVADPDFGFQIPQSFSRQ